MLRNPGDSDQSAIAWVGEDTGRTVGFGGSFGAEAGSVAQFRRIDMPFAEDVCDGEVACEQLIGDDPAMAAPPHGLRTHEHTTRAFAPADEGLEVGSELLGEAVVGVVVEASVLPPGVGLEGHRATDWSTTSQTLETAQLDAHPREVGLKGVGVELGIPIRTRESADVDDDLGAGVREEIDELVEFTIRMPDRQQARRVLRVCRFSVGPGILSSVRLPCRRSGLPRHSSLTRWRALPL